jgi:hypothetical protein
MKRTNEKKALTLVLHRETLRHVKGGAMKQSWNNTACYTCPDGCVYTLNRLTCQC